MAEASSGKAGRSLAWGPLSFFGLVVAAAVFALDQAAKFWLLYPGGLIDHIPDPVAPFVNFTLTWNTGISYGLLPQQGPLGAWALFAFEILAVVFLWGWLARASWRITALGLGLIMGGAAGNALDRLHWPGVMDFVDLHVGNFHWYVFNLADVAIVAGVIGLLYESVWPGDAAKAP